MKPASDNFSPSSLLARHRDHLVLAVVIAAGALSGFQSAIQGQPEWCYWEALATQPWPEVVGPDKMLFGYLPGFAVLIRPFITLFQKENIKRILYGSDGICACSFHGNYPAMGRSWAYFEADKRGFNYPHCDGRPIVSVYEQILSMKHAAEIAELNQDDIEDIFWRNAYREFGLEG